jgi:hypothetical protein
MFSFWAQAHFVAQGSGFLSLAGCGAAEALLVTSVSLQQGL